ncbi:MAG: insulinase family protein [Bryobacterales bacterium]|nr:insulinase family protein [Bryobacterales bacterium]MBV9397436.1 insulinase family protein [Bryobacterales bacterium]
MRARFLLLLIPGLLAAQSLQDFEKKVTKFTLPNGLTMLVIERHEAPVVSFHTYVNVGSVDDPSGRTGLAHMFEHMAFKGTESIGTKNWPEEKKALDSVEQVYDRLEEELNKGFRSDPKKIEALRADLAGAIDKANSFVEPNEFDRIVESNGGVGMNASTAEDQTQFFYSFPSNRIELWFLLESSRFLHPVLREFYKERDVVREERRMSTESSPLGKLVEQLLATAFTAHPYKTSPIGWSSDIEQLRRTDAEAFYKRYYTPGNLTIAIAGDVNPAEAHRLADKYFARLPKGPPPPRVRTIEPPQEGQKRVAVASAAQPFLVVGYKRPNQYSPDDAPLDVLSDILSDGRTGIIYKDMVRDKQIALGAESGANFPGGKYPSLFFFFVVPSSGHTVEENEKAVDQIVARIKTEKVDEASLQRVKTKLRAALIRKLDNNSGLARELAFYDANFGDWRRIFTELDDYNKVTAEDVMRVAKTYLVEDSRTVAYTYTPARDAKVETRGEAK